MPGTTNRSITSLNLLVALVIGKPFGIRISGKHESLQTEMILLALLINIIKIIIVIISRIRLGCEFW